MSVRNKLWFAAAAALTALPCAAQISDGVIKIGVLNDQSGLYADLTGQGSVVAARMGNLAGVVGAADLARR